MKRLAGDEQTVVGVEVVVEVVVVQNPATTIPVGIPHATIAVRIQPDKIMQNTIHATTIRILSGLNLIRYLNFIP